MAKKKTAKSASKAKSAPSYWLVKSEPHVFSIDDLKSAPKKTTHWDGVRNYQARNIMRDEMKIGDQVLYYHSNAEPPGVVGICEIVREGYPDFTAWDENDPHFDPKTDKDNPRWMMVDVKFVEKFKRLVSLSELKAAEELSGMVLLQKGSRLSVQPVSQEHFEFIVQLGRQEEE